MLQPRFQIRLAYHTEVGRDERPLQEVDDQRRMVGQQQSPRGVVFAQAGKRGVIQRHGSVTFAAGASDKAGPPVVEYSHRFTHWRHAFDGVRFRRHRWLTILMVGIALWACCGACLSSAS